MKIRLIIVDDHAIFIDGMRALLKTVQDMEVVGSAENGVQAIELCESLKPDVLLTDIQMPGKDGIQASKEIHRRFPEIKIIALSMMNEGINVRKMMDAGASGYVLKTIDKDELVSVIRKVQAGEKHFGSELAEPTSAFTSRSANPIDSLTRREKEILIHIAQGLTDKEIADKVFLSPHTIITHRKNILSKLGLKNKVELTRFAIDNNLV
jgi:DNA-binding NarL/FixJ family response regulator